eukprot:m.303983 g.303983  ORF g.303983 m.303983 type:complete len:89 (-) comp20171_c0_seq2:445-711(-)
MERCVLVYHLKVCSICVWRVEVSGLKIQKNCIGASTDIAKIVPYKCFGIVWCVIPLQDFPLYRLYALPCNFLSLCAVTDTVVFVRSLA